MKYEVHESSRFVYGQTRPTKILCKIFEPCRRTVIVSTNYKPKIEICTPIFINVPKIRFHVEVMSTNIFKDTGVKLPEGHWFCNSLSVDIMKNNQWDIPFIPNTTHGMVCLGRFWGVGSNEEDSADKTIDYFWESKFSTTMPAELFFL